MKKKLSEKFISKYFKKFRQFQVINYEEINNLVIQLKNSRKEREDYLFWV